MKMILSQERRGVALAILHRRVSSIRYLIYSLHRQVLQSRVYSIDCCHVSANTAQSVQLDIYVSSIVGGGKAFSEEEYTKVLELIAASAKVRKDVGVLPSCSTQFHLSQVPDSREHGEAIKDLHAVFHHVV